MLSDKKGGETKKKIEGEVFHWDANLEEKISSKRNLRTIIKALEEGMRKIAKISQKVCLPPNVVFVKSLITILKNVDF